MNINLNTLPIIHDIPPQYLWVPPAAGVAAYYLPSLLQKIFPYDEPDRWPLSFIRNRLSYTYHDNISFRYPEFYEFVHIIVQKNLPLAVFLVAMAVLKPADRYLLNEKISLIGATIMISSIIAIPRQIAYLISKTVADRSSNQKLGFVCRKISNLIATPALTTSS